MPNHFHIIVKQQQDKGIYELLSKLSNSYTKYFNTKYNRVGPLFQGEFKAVEVETDEQLVHLSRYIHLNPVAASLVGKIEDYPWSSYLEYTNDTDSICSIQDVLAFFKGRSFYQKFVEDQISYAKQLNLEKRQFLD